VIHVITKYRARRLVLLARYFTIIGMVIMLLGGLILFVQ